MAGTLAGKRILVVEDEYFIAADIKRELTKEEAIVVGPAGDLSRGLLLADGGPIDAAVLDVNLEGATSYPLADVLSARAIPYMFLTGYDGWALPDRYRQVPRVGKPFATANMLACVRALVSSEMRA